MKWMYIVVFFLPVNILSAQVYQNNNPLAHTYSIVARDTKTGEMAVGVQSHWFSVGTTVSWAKAGVGAVATQSFVDKSYGPKALALIEKGYTATEALKELLQQDPNQNVRQVAIIDHQGNVAVHTGSHCIQYANHIQGNNYSVQSNMMLNNTVCKAMADAFEKTAHLPLGERVIAALAAAESAGGDIRGKQSAVLLVVSGNKKEAWNNALVDLRVDDHAQPITELKRLYQLHKAYQYMNDGDLAVEKGDMENAMKNYNAAMKLFPQNLEMQYWTAITLLNNKKINQAFDMLKKIYKQDKNWKSLTERLAPVGLLTVDSEVAEALKKL